MNSINSNCFSINNNNYQPFSDSNNNNIVVNGDDSNLSPLNSSDNEQRKKRKISPHDENDNQAEVNQVAEDQLDNDQEEASDMEIECIDILGKIKFFARTQPQEWYPFQIDSSAKIKIQLPNFEKKKIIYSIHNRNKNLSYIGKTNNLYHRVYYYISLLNNTNSIEDLKTHKLPFYEDMKQNPTHFQLGVLCKLQDDEDINEYERNFIRYRTNLYNKRNGGGGGLAHSEESTMTFAIPNNDGTPKRYYPYNEELKPQLSPGYKKLIKETKTPIYYYKVKSESYYYIGMTGHPEWRPGQHGYRASLEKIKSSVSAHKRNELHYAMSQDPTAYGFGLLPVVDARTISPKSLCNYKIVKGAAETESALIEMGKEQSSQVCLNVRTGGGGPSPTSARRKLTFRTE